MISAAVEVLHPGLHKATALVELFPSSPRERQTGETQSKNCSSLSFIPMQEHLLSKGVPIGTNLSSRTVATTYSSLTSWGAGWEDRMVICGGQQIIVLEVKAFHLAFKALIHSIQGRNMIRTDCSSTIPQGPQVVSSSTNCFGFFYRLSAFGISEGNLPPRDCKLGRSPPIQV